eukprot:6178165-Pleurochrysis_carterae.AAC.1
MCVCTRACVQQRAWTCVRVCTRECACEYFACESAARVHALSARHGKVVECARARAGGGHARAPRLRVSRANVHVGRAHQHTCGCLSAREHE